MPDPKPTRPYMPGYGLEGAQRRPGERLPWRNGLALLQSTRTYWVCTTRPDGRPHGAPVWGVWLDDAFWFSTGRETRKAKNIAANPEVAVLLHGGDDLAVILEGAVQEVTGRSAPARFVEVCEAKYDWHFEPEFLEGSVCYRVRPRVAFSFAEELVETATRWQFGD